MIRLAKLALWALQDDRVALAWRPCDDHVCGAVAISAGEKKTRKSEKQGATATLPGQVYLRHVGLLTTSIWNVRGARGYDCPIVL
jgi:hypothetical protein